MHSHEVYIHVYTCMCFYMYYTYAQGTALNLFLCMMLRYCAQCKSMEEGTSSLDSFSVVRDDPNEMGQLGLDSCNTKRKPASHVFLCHRGYNHISGKLIKSHKH